MVAVQKCSSGKFISVGNIGAEINVIGKKNGNMRMVMYFGALMRRISPRQSPRTFGLPKVLGGYR